MKIFRHTLSFVLCFVMLLAVALTCPPVSNVSAESLSDLQNQLEDAKAQSNQLKAEIAALEKANAPYEQQKAALNKQINATQKEIDLYQSQINALNSEIHTLERAITQTQADVRNSVNSFKKRLVAMYTGNTMYTGLEFLSDTDGLAEYLSKQQMLESISKRDSDALKKLLDYIEKLDKQQAEIELRKSELADSKKVIDQKKIELTQQYNQVNKIVSANNSTIHNLEKKQKDYAQMQKDLAAAIANKQNSGGSSVTGSGKFTWPVPGYYRLSEKYGNRICPVHGKEFHQGIDIASSGIYGAKIVAADSGTIILNKRYGDYGYCVMIDHGNGYVTLYAHMKAKGPLAVGTKVTKGQSVIGYVGSTGASTGPHLHFEIQKTSGGTIDPMTFF